MARAGVPKGGVMALTIKDKKTLYSSYMPFIKNGGLFIPTSKSFQLNDEVFLLLTLLDAPERYPITGKVVWISTKAKGTLRPAGIGIQFNEGSDAQIVIKKIETAIVAMANSEMPTYTM